MRVQVLNGSGIAGAAGRLTERLEGEGWDMLPAGNAPQRYGASAVYYSHDVLQDQAAEIAADTGVGGVVVLPMPSPAPFVVEGAGVYVVVLIGADDLGGSLRPPARSSSLRPRPRNDVALPLSDSTPRDRYVPGLLDVQIFRADNDQASDEMKGVLNALSGWFNIAGRYMALAARRAGHLPADLEPHMDYDYLQNQVWPNIERSLEWLGFTPQNVCGAPAGYSFTDLIKPTREFDPQTQNYNGDAIFTTDRLIELHGGQRINPQENLDFYIRQAAQTAHDALRIRELVSETETMQIILCEAWISPEGKTPSVAHVLGRAGFIPGVQPLENLLSQGTYHVKEISRNGNFAFLIVCHPTIGERYVRLWWREGGYRAEVTGKLQNNGCQATYEIETYREDTYGTENIFVYGFGEQALSAADLQSFPRG